MRFVAERVRRLCAIIKTYFMDWLDGNAIIGAGEDSTAKAAWCEHLPWGNGDISGCEMSAQIPGTSQWRRETLNTSQSAVTLFFFSLFFPSFNSFLTSATFHFHLFLCLATHAQIVAIALLRTALPQL